MCILLQFHKKEGESCKPCLAQPRELILESRGSCMREGMRGGGSGDWVLELLSGRLPAGPAGLRLTGHQAGWALLRGGSGGAALQMARFTAEPKIPFLFS